jgi:hypothetical protein
MASGLAQDRRRLREALKSPPCNLNPPSRVVRLDEFSEEILPQLEFPAVAHTRPDGCGRTVRRPPSRSLLRKQKRANPTWWACPQNDVVL